MEIKSFFDEATYTLTYVVYDPKSADAVVIDPVLDYDPQASKISHESYQQVKDFILSSNLKLRMVLETHAHADHLSSAQLFKEDFPDVGLAIGENIRLVQETFKNVYNLPEGFRVNGSQFDRLLKDGEEFNAGTIKVTVIATPGHTPACSSYLIDDAVFTGDALFMPDYGTGRCDFPRGDAETLYHSVHEKLYHLPDETRVFVGHDYKPGGRDLAYQSTIGEQKRKNIQLNIETSKSEFVEFREKRDATLKAPKLIYQSIQVNIDAGKLPGPESNSKRYLKIPINE